MANSKKRRAERRQAAPATTARPTDVAVAATSYAPWILGAVLVVASLVAYVPAIRGAFIWDDNLHITNNQTLRAANGLWRIWFERGAIPQYYPLVHTSFWVEHALWGMNPLGYHIQNVLLHGLNTALVYTTSKRVFALAGVTVHGDEVNAWPSVIAALVFVIMFFMGAAGGRSRGAWW